MLKLYKEVMKAEIFPPIWFSILYWTFCLKCIKIKRHMPRMILDDYVVKIRLLNPISLIVLLVSAIVFGVMGVWEEIIRDDSILF